MAADTAHGDETKFHGGRGGWGSVRSPRPTSEGEDDAGRHAPDGDEEKMAERFFPGAQEAAGGHCDCPDRKSDRGGQGAGSGYPSVLIS